MYKVQGKQSKTQGMWMQLSTANTEYMAIQLADTIKLQGVYVLIRVVDKDGMLVYQA
jgi:hypothetical protein